MLPRKQRRRQRPQALQLSESISSSQVVVEAIPATKAMFVSFPLLCLSVPPPLGEPLAAPIAGQHHSSEFLPASGGAEPPVFPVYPAAAVRATSAHPSGWHSFPFEVPSRPFLGHPCSLSYLLQGKIRMCFLECNYRISLHRLSPSSTPPSERKSALQFAWLSSKLK